MYLHLGQDTVVRTHTVVGIFDSDNATLSRHTRDYLNDIQRQGRLVSITDDIFKSFIVCVDESGEETVYLSQLSAATLRKRLDDTVYDKRLKGEQHQ